MNAPQACLLKTSSNGMNRFRTVSHQWAENPYLEGHANFRKQESEVAKPDRTTVSADKLRQLMSEVILLREKVAQAELVATDARFGHKNHQQGQNRIA